MKTTLNMIVVLASICVGCSTTVLEDEPQSPSATAEKPRCLVADPFKPAAALPQVAREDYLRRAPESEKRTLKASVERTSSAAAAPQRVDAAVQAKQAEYLKRAHALANGFAGTQEDLDAALGKLKLEVVDAR